MSTRAGGGGRKIRGVIIGIVTNIKDPEEIGRVKVRFPWMDGAQDPIDSHWARLCGWYAGNSRGTLYVPEIGDEVLVAFEGGDPNHPYILGAVFNGQHHVPGPGNPDGKNDHKWFRSRSGHDMEFLDTDGAEKIRLVDSSQNNSIVYDTAADTWTTEAKTGTINIAAPKGYIHIDCVDFTQTTTKSRKLEVGEKHTVTVGQARTLKVDDANWVQMAGTSYTVTTPQFASTTKTDVGIEAGMMVNNQGQYSTEVGKWTELQQGPVVRTAGSQTIATQAYTTVNTAGDSPAVFTLLAGALTVSSKGGVFFNGGPTTMMGGLINAKASGAVMAKDLNGGKAALSTWLGGLLMLNPNTLTFPATKMLDPIVGMDFHGPTLPAPIPAPPLPLVPMPFAGPILIDIKPTVLINFRPAAGSGATAISFHMPPLPWPWVPLSYRPILTAAIMALATAPFTAMLEMGKAKMAALAAGSGSPILKRGFVADFIGSSHVQPPADTSAVGDSHGTQQGDQGQITFSRLFPMFSSAQTFIGFLAGLLPLPVATASVNMNSPTTTVCDAPLGMMIPLGSNSCSDLPPIVPNAAVVGFSNVLTGMSIGDFLGQLAWAMLTAKATQKFQGGLRKGGNALARKIGNSNSPRLQNAAQKVNDFLGGENCIAAGHPVDVVSGTVFTEAVDFELFGAQTATWRRFYNAKAEDMRGDASAFGPGWRHSYDQVLIADETEDGVRTLALRDDENKIVGFDLPLADGERDFHPYLRLTLTRVDGRTYEIADPNGNVRVFRFGGGTPGQVAPPTYQPPPGKSARLVALREPMGGDGVRLNWQRDRLTGFTDACGREVVVEYTHAGQISELRLKRAQGRACDIFLARYRYDGDGRLIAHEDRNRNLRWYRYDHRSRLTRETDRNGYSFHFHYDEQDRCTHTYGDDNAFYCAFEYLTNSTIVGDALGGVTRYRFDDQSRVTEAHDAEGGITLKTYTEQGWLETETDPNGNLTEHVYDARGNLEQTIDPLGHATQLKRDADGHLVELVDALQGRWLYQRDAAGRLSRTRSPKGRTRTFEYDDAGRLVRWTDGTGDETQRKWSQGLVERDVLADGRRVLYEYDALGFITTRIERTVDGLERVLRVKRDGEGNLTSVARPDGRVDAYEYLPEGQVVTLRRGASTARQRFEGWGRLVEQIDPLGRSTRFEHDPHHDLTAVTLPGGRRWTYLRDKLGRATTVRAPDGTTTRYTFDPGGRLVHEVRSEGGVVRRSYDAGDNLTRIDWGDGVVQRFAYDPMGRLTRAEATGHRLIKRAYDADGDLIIETQGDQALRWRYDARGRVVQRDATWGDRERFAYDGNGLTQLHDTIGGVHTFEHDTWGQRTQWIRAGGARHDRRFDASGRLTGETLIDPDGVRALERTLTWTEADAIGLVDERDPHGKVRHEYRYDAADRLVAWRQDDHLEHAFEFDDLDNIVRDGNIERTHDGDRLEADGTGNRYRHDGRGRLVAISNGGQARRLWFDRRDRLVRVHTADDRIIHHSYDAVGRLSETWAEQEDGSARSETFYWHGSTLARRVVRDLADESIVRDERYTFDPDRPFHPLLRVVAGGDRRDAAHYYTTDQRGAAIRLTDTEGKALWRAQYDPYGRCDEAGHEVGEQPLRLLGQVHDATTELSHHRFRVYAPRIGRFVSPDPLGLAGGRHPFAYPEDPIGWADPFGLAKKKKRNIVYRYLRPADVASMEAGTGIHPKTDGGSIGDHVQGKPTQHVSAFEADGHSESKRYDSGNGLVAIDVDKAQKGGAKFIDHNNVVQGTRRTGDLKAVQNATDTREVLFKGTIPMDAIEPISESQVGKSCRR